MNIQIDYNQLISTGNAIELSQSLQQLPFDTKKQTIDNNDLLMLAVNKLQNNCVKVLIEHGADIDKTFQSEGNKTALGQACFLYSCGVTCQYKTWCLQILKFLIKAGADCNKAFDHTPLINICGYQSSFSKMDKKERKGIIKLLIDYGADRHVVNQGGQTAELCARFFKYDVIADFMRDYQADVPDTKGVHE